jgi:hypothetical protein|tara:strand:+ start:311 stop:664 length:354 start_codon:yes stop_codon:yes gene_type:complete
MDTKEELITHIRSWIDIDNEISKLQKQIKDFRNEKKELTGSLVDIMKTNEIDCFDINDGKLIYAKSKVKKPINKKTLLNALEGFFKEDVKMATQLSEHILNSREETVKESIRRKKDK